MKEENYNCYAKRDGVEKELKSIYLIIRGFWFMEKKNEKFIYSVEKFQRLWTNLVLLFITKTRWLLSGQEYLTLTVFSWEFYILFTAIRKSILRELPKEVSFLNFSNREFELPSATSAFSTVRAFIVGK